MGDYDEENQLVADRWVRVLADYSCEGVWQKDGIPADIDELPVSDELRKQFLAWQEEYNRLWDIYLEDEEYRPEPFPGWNAFSAWGLELAKAVKVQLLDWTVIYYDEEKSWESSYDDTGKRKPRSYIEYEITLNGNNK